MERLGQFEILESRLWDEVMNTQSEKNEILVKVKGLQKKIASFKTDVTGMKSVNKKLENFNDFLDEPGTPKSRLMKLCASRILNY